MTYRGHLLVGSSVAYGAWLISPALSIGVRLSMLLLVMLGSLAPDLDAPGSWLPRRVLGPFRYGLYLVRWSISNPLTWLLFGRVPTRHPPPLNGPWRAVRWAWWALGLPFERMRTGRERVHWIVAHRGFSHSFCGVGLATLTFGIALTFGHQALRVQVGANALAGVAWVGGPFPSAAWAILMAVAFGIGCLSHLAADGCTVSGVPLLLPWSDTRYGIGPKWARLRTH
jgi:membrane-bound metal-dependent hydrolase YbcI (DUF457 family)